MLDILKKLLPSAKKEELSIEEIASFVKMDKEALLAFEKAYHVEAINREDKNLFRQRRGDSSGERLPTAPSVESLISRIVQELIDQTLVYDSEIDDFTLLPKENPEKRVSLEEVLAVEELQRPFLTGYFARRDINDKRPSDALIFYYKKHLETGEIMPYHRFRQGLDILDLDFISYHMLSMNENSMMNYLPKINGVVKEQGFFKIPATKIFKAPMSLMQTIRTSPYESLNQTTKDIINRYVFEMLHLDTDKNYFIKTGTFSSKFFFRNAKVEKGEEVKETGLYLYFIQSQAQAMASPLNNKSIYGVSTTNDFVVREFIEDPENHPTIYSGLPLRTEYRVFVDFDEKEILHIHPYWDPECMKKNFSKGSEESVHQFHDYVIFQAEEERLMHTFEKNKPLIEEKIQDLLKMGVPLGGQWSLDIMQNAENDFYLIDMAKADESSFSEFVPEGKLKFSFQNWIPVLGENKN